MAWEATLSRDLAGHLRATSALIGCAVNLRKLDARRASVEERGVFSAKIVPPVAALSRTFNPRVQSSSSCHHQNQ